MARGILSEYGPERRIEGNRPTSGGVERARDVMNYQAPQGPMGIMGNNRPGLGGENCGNAGTQGKSSCGPGGSGSPGLHGTNKGNSGTQR